MVMHMKRRLYLESTIPSYLVAAPSRDLLVAAHHQVTTDWWGRRRRGFELYVSQFVLDEIALGDPAVARRRTDAVRGIPLLSITEEVYGLAEAMVASKAIPRKAGTDAAHIALAAVHQMDFLLTWNCAHIANAAIIRSLERVCARWGVVCPVICTPEELMGEIP